MGGVAVALEVRPATSEDVSRVGEILVEGFRGKFGRMFGQRIDRAPHVLAQLAALWLAQPENALFVADVDGRAVGALQILAHSDQPDDLVKEALILLRELGPFHALRCAIGLSLPHEEETGGTAYISDVAVDGSFRGKGIGSALLASAEEWARERSRQGLSLHVAIANPARRLYERFGFRLEKQQTSRLSEWLFGISSWLYMVKPL